MSNDVFGTILIYATNRCYNLKMRWALSWSVHGKKKLTKQNNEEDEFIKANVEITLKVNLSYKTA